MRFFDRTRVSTRRMTKEGFMEATARVGRPGVQQYIKDVDFVADDLPERLRMKPAGSTINLLRPTNEVFNPASMSSFEGKPITNNHPVGAFVDATNVKRFQVGFSKSVNKVGDGEAIEAKLIVQDANAIKDIKGGKEQISLGYESAINWTPGVDEVYGAFDGIQTNIVGNHIAIVDRARAGVDFRLNDNYQPNKGNKGKTKMKTRVIDGKQFELSDDAADIFDAMKADNDAKAKAITEAKTKIADIAAELETVKGERDAAKAKTITDADIEAKVAERAKARTKLVDTATKAVKDIDTTDKADRDIKVEVITKLGDGKVEIPEDATDVYVDATFNALVATANTKAKSLADGLGGEQPNTVVDADTAREEMKKRRTATA